MPGPGAETFSPLRSPADAFSLLYTPDEASATELLLGASDTVLEARRRGDDALKEAVEEDGAAQQQASPRIQGAAAAAMGAARRPPPTPPPTWARSTVQELLAHDICATASLEELESLRVPLSWRQGSPACDPEPPLLGTWMIWMVHRVALNDPELVELDFSTHCLPNEERVAPKLMSGLRSNTHLRALLLADCGLRGPVGLLAAALAENRALRTLDLSSNVLAPQELQSLFDALADNRALEVFRCSNQFSAPLTREAFASVARALKKNRALLKLGVELRDPHYRDQISRALVRNADLARRRRAEAQRSARRRSGGA